MSDVELPVIEVEGDPRAMGRSQGETCRDAIRDAVAAVGVASAVPSAVGVSRGRLPFSLRPFAAGRVMGAGAGREIVRHYPHLCERIQGLARGSGQSIESLMELFLASPDRALRDPAPAAARAGDESILVRPVSRSRWIVRRSRPEVGFRSVELTLPGLASAIAGVNESGVAVVIAPVAPARVDGAAPPALLLVQECLQRFHDVTGCIDWCLKRPASGGSSIVVADAAGEVAAILLDDDGHRVAHASGGVLVAGGCGELHPELRKSLEGAPLPGAESAVLRGAPLAALLGARLELSPQARRLCVQLSRDGETHSFGV